MPSQFLVGKVRGFPDPLVAMGLAAVVQGLGSEHVHVTDAGRCYIVSAEIPDPSAWQPVVLAPLIRTSKNRDRLPSDYPLIVDYEEEKARRAEFFGAKPEEKKRIAIYPNWSVVRAINPFSLSGYNKLLTNWWASKTAQREIVLLLFKLFSSLPNDVPTAIEMWSDIARDFGWKIPASVNALSLYNPDQGKGQSRPKANRFAISGIASFWLLEWLKAIGFYEAALTTLIRDSKDRKTYVLSPVDLDYSDHVAVLRQFRSLTDQSKPAITSDILASIRYVRAMLRYAAENAEYYQRLRTVEQPNRVVSGFQMAFYKSLGQASATMNLAFVALPNWIAIRTPDDLVATEALLGEIEALVRALDESYVQAFRLLQYLRAFVLGGESDAFFRFIVGYASHITRLVEQRKYIHYISTDFVRRMLVASNKKLAPILNSKGFTAIATAIQRSTVVPQYASKKFRDRRYDVRYGLGQALVQKSRYVDDFAAALGDFVHLYANENAQVRARGKGPYRPDVTPDDLKEVLELVDEYGPKLIANLLVGVGYAWSPRKSEDAPADLDLEAASEDAIARDEDETVGEENDEE